ncbi:MAG TPA: ATP-binding protein [Nocardioidaceae bacterium]
MGANAVAIPAESGDDQDQAWSVPFRAVAVRSARTTITVALRRLGVSSQVIEDARIVVSELLGNALRHARPLPDGTLRVGLAVEDAAVRLYVVDGGSATLPTLLNPPPMALGGRGLSIVRTLTRDWGVHETLSGNTVFGVLNLA